MIDSFLQLACIFVPESPNFGIWVGIFVVNNDGGSGQCLWLRSEHVLLVIMRPRNELNFENVLLTCNFETTGP